jgi:hypothetical protein
VGLIYDGSSEATFTYPPSSSVLHTLDITNDYTDIFDGNNLNEWLMAGKGKFVALAKLKKSSNGVKYI